MVKQDVKFSDGTRIFYEEVNGVTHRFIEYAINPQERERIKANPSLKSVIESKVKKFNAGKYYYLEIIRNLVSPLDDSQKQQIYAELKKLHDKVGQEYDVSIVKEFPETFGKYWANNKIQCAAFFVTIYLAMLDLEEGKRNYPNSLGKTMVLRSCKAVILDNKDPRDAATMFQRKKSAESNDVVSEDYYDWESDSPYAKYNGYNGFDDDTIDIAFDGHPEATWNVD